MASKKPYEQFGPYILFKKLEADALGDLWRAARIENNAIGSVVALRRLSGGNREALGNAALEMQQVIGSLTGPSFARDQRIDVIGGIPAISWDYASGRSLRSILDRARGGNGAQPNPIPIDQVLVIAERIALSLATSAELNFAGERLMHGGLIPQFVWITDDGEIRVGGQHLGSGLVPSLRDEKVASDIGRYFSPEYQHSGKASKGSEVYSTGAILYALLTGHEPPDALRASAFTQAVRSAKTTAGNPVPDEIRTILEKSLNLDPSARFASIADMKQALSALGSSGKYTATSFNLAFYLSNLLKKELETEAVEREKEAQTNVAPYLQTLMEAPAAIPFAAPHAAMPEADAQPGRSKLPVAIAATVLLAAVGGGAWFMLGRKQQPATKGTAPQLASTAAPLLPQRQPVMPEPIVASATPETTATTTAATMTGVDEATQKKAFEDAVKAKMQAEMMKLQQEYTRQLQQQQSRNAPVVLPNTPPPAAARADERELSAADLDQQRRDVPAAQELTQPAATQTQAPQVATQSAPAVSTQAPAPAVVQAPAIREGDVIEASLLDSMPEATRPPRPTYPPIAARQKIEATVMASVLVSEKGEVIDVKVLRGDARFGFNDAAVRALKAARYTPPVKDGKRVRTWIPQVIQFKP